MKYEIWSLSAAHLDGRLSSNSLDLTSYQTSLIASHSISWHVCSFKTIIYNIYVGDIMLVICILISRVDVGDSFYYVGANIYILVTCFVTNIEKLSPTDFVSNIRHQHRCSLSLRIYECWFNKRKWTVNKHCKFWCSRTDTNHSQRINNLRLITTKLNFWSCSGFWQFCWLISLLKN